MTDHAHPISESYWVIPGQFLAGEYPGRFGEEQTRLRLDSLLEAGFETFIDLTQPGELPPYITILKGVAKIYERQVKYLNFPILDRGLPARTEMISILDSLDDALSKGHKVYIHCWGGVGRTGTSVGCYLVRHGKTGHEALEQIAVWWQDVPKHLFFPRSPETDLQVQYILDWKE